MSFSIAMVAGPALFRKPWHPGGNQGDVGGTAGADIRFVYVPYPLSHEIQ